MKVSQAPVKVVNTNPIVIELSKGEAEELLFGLEQYRKYKTNWPDTNLRDYYTKFGKRFPHIDSGVMIQALSKVIDFG